MGVKLGIPVSKAGGAKAVTPTAVDGSIIADMPGFPAVAAGCTVPGHPQKALAWRALRSWGCP